jgi:hypothetical protein
VNDTRLFFAKFLDHQKIIMTFDSLFSMQAGATMPHVARFLQTLCTRSGLQVYTYTLLAQPVQFTSSPTASVLISEVSESK